MQAWATALATMQRCHFNVMLHQFTEQKILQALMTVLIMVGRVQALTKIYHMTIPSVTTIPRDLYNPT